MVENTFSTELLEGRPLESTIMGPGKVDKKEYVYLLGN